MRLAFLGTPDFGVPALRALHAAGHDIAGVFCQPDRPSGRGGRTVSCPVKKAALELQLPVLQFEKIRGQAGLDALRALGPDVCVTAAFGQILSRKNLDVPRLGTVNVHGSILPKYRGAAPIQWAVINGEAETGVTTMLTAAGVDTGDILLCEKTPIGPEETAGELFARLAEIGAELVVKTLEGLEKGTITPIPQDDSLATRCGMLTKEHGRIDLTKTAREICNLVRGCDPWPGAFLRAGDRVFKVYKAAPAGGHGAPGEVIAAGGGLVLGCGGGAVEIVEMQAPGGKRMSARDWLRGHEWIGVNV